jgi:drug/metabolite transporter (DMT)-like permease
MSGEAITLVLLAAVLHAAWNALVKASGDRGVTLALIALGHLVLGLLIAWHTPLPGRDALPYILASTVIHWGYYWAIFHGYRLGDLSLIYPLSRGLAPLLIAVTAALVIGERLETSGWIGIAAISIGVALLAYGALRQAVDRLTLLLGLLLAAIIASYSLVDGIGARLASSSLAYMAWLFIFEGIAAAWLAWRRRRVLRRLAFRQWALGLSGGVASALAYGLAIHAMTIAPVGLVSAVRETSVVIAALIGTLLFGERPLIPRLLAAGIVVAGVFAIGLW